MSYDYNFPDVGEGITEGKLVKWLVKEGDPIKTDMPLAEIETDKSIVQIPSPTNGIAEKLFYKEGDIIQVKKPIMHISTEEILQAPQQTQSNNNSINTNYQSYQNMNRPISQSNEILALPNVRNAAKQKGIDLTKIKGTGKDGRISMLDIEAQDSQKVSLKQKAYSTIDISSREEIKDILATPSTRMLARELGVNINSVKPTGENGIITKDDIRNMTKKNQKQEETIENTMSASAGYMQPQKSETQNESFSEINGELIERIPLSQMRKAISRNMIISKNMTVPYTVFEEADVTEIVKIREKEKKNYEKKGIKLTYLPFFTKAVILTLAKHPTLNSSLDEEKQELIIKKFYNIGIATDTPDGLIVPVIKNAERKSIVEIGEEINELAEKARNKKIKPNEMKDSSFTITSIGNIAGQYFTQMINYPNTAILGIGKIVDKPVVIKGKIRSKIVPRKILPLSLTSDHRIIDGAEASRFLETLKEYLTDIDSLLLEME